MPKELPLTQGRVAIVDDEDFERLSQYRWRYNVYAKRSLPRAAGQPQKAMYLHREIMQPPAGMEVDHINGDRLDNRRSNLRVCTRAENQANRKAQAGSSRYKGVSLWKRHKRYAAGLSVDGKWQHLGWFDDEVAAARAYDEAAVRYRGEFARTNFPRQTVTA